MTVLVRIERGPPEYSRRGRGGAGGFDAHLLEPCLLELENVSAIGPANLNGMRAEETYGRESTTRDMA